MAGPYTALWRMVHARVPIGVVVYTSPASRDGWVEEVEALLGPSGKVSERVISADDLFEKVDRQLLALPHPEAEAEWIEQLSVRRDLLNRRVAPAVLFLERDGPGLDALASQAALASFFQGVIVDPEMEQEVDLREERRRFEEATGEPADRWLARYRNGELPDTLDHSLLHLRALLLETSR